MARFDAVIFDLFGTIVDNFTNELQRSYLVRMAALLGAPAEPFVALWKGSFNQRASGAFASVEENIRHVCAELGVEPAEDAVAEAAAIRFELSRDVLVPREGTVETIALLRERGIRIGLISDCSWEVPRLWDATPFGPLFDATIFSCEVGVKKPDPRIYALACERLGVAPERCLYVGDGGSRELSGAGAAGMTPLLIRSGQEDENRYDEDDWVGDPIASVRQVLDVVF